MSWRMINLHGGILSFGGVGRCPFIRLFLIAVALIGCAPAFAESGHITLALTPAQAIAIAKSMDRGHPENVPPGFFGIQIDLERFALKADPASAAAAGIPTQRICLTGSLSAIQSIEPCP